MSDRILLSNERGELLNVLREARSHISNLPCMMNRFGECDLASIQSHTLSASQLRIIAENGELYCLTPNMKGGPHEPDFQPKKIGVRAAASFKGFCKAHDQQLFRPIDTKQIEPRAKNFELLFFRALAQEISKKAASVLMFNAYYFADESLRSDGSIESVAYRTALGLRDNFWDFDVIGRGRTSPESEIQFACFDLECSSDIACVGVLNPEAFQIYFPDASPYDGRVFRNVLYAVLPTEVGQRIAFAWFKGANHTVKPLLDRFTVAKGSLLEFSLQFCVEHCECTFFRPSTWESFSSRTVEALSILMGANIHGTPYNPLLRPLGGAGPDFSYKFLRQHTNSSWAKIHYGRKHIS